VGKAVEDAVGTHAAGVTVLLGDAVDVVELGEDEVVGGTTAAPLHNTLAICRVTAVCKYMELFSAESHLWASRHWFAQEWCPERRRPHRK
jgi:hypothetical protein